jgi:hypothetical protein
VQRDTFDKSRGHDYCGLSGMEEKATENLAAMEVEMAA